MNDLSQPLVSIIVITYNSSKYVLETLESAKAQTYQNIELIVSDDCSTDNTVEICRDWIFDNKNRFVRTELMSAEKNTGISANCNRGVKLANGEWVKLIAGDDTLMSYCINSFIVFIQNNATHNIKALHSNMNVYNDYIDNNSLICVQDKKGLFNEKRVKALNQYQLLLRDVYYIASPSAFYSLSLLNDLSGFDETMPYEDWPFYLKVTKMGCKFYFLNESTVNYRIHSNSFSNSENNITNNGFFTKEKIVYKAYRRPFITVLERLNEDSFYFLREILFKYKLERNTSLFKSLYNVIKFNYINIKFAFNFYLFRKIKTHLNNYE